MNEQPMSSASVSDAGQAGNSSDLPHKHSELDHMLSVLGHEMAILFGTSTEKFDYDLVACVPDQTKFKLFINFIIFANALQLGLCVTYEYQELGLICFYFQVLFTTIFAVEALLKIRAQRYKYFRSIWNQMDFALVILGIFDAAFQAQRSGSYAKRTNCKTCSELSLLRVMRLTRALRLFRILRSNRRLMILTESLAASVRAMFWVATLLFVIVYACGIFAYGAFGEEKEEVGWDTGYFDSLFDSMLTLFGMTILDLWGDVVRPVANHYPSSLFFFVVYVFISSFGVLNLMIGIIIDSTMKASREFERLEENMERKNKLDQIHETAGLLFDSAVTDGNKLMTIEELLRASKQQEMFDMLEQVNMPPGFTMPDFFMMCTPNTSLTRQAFIDAMKRILLSNQFERDCLLQHGVNDIRRRLDTIESAFGEIHAISQATQSLHKLVKQSGPSFDEHREEKNKSAAGIGAGVFATQNQDGTFKEFSTFKQDASPRPANGVESGIFATHTQDATFNEITTPKQYAFSRPTDGIESGIFAVQKQDVTFNDISTQISGVERISEELRATGNQLKADIKGMLQPVESELQVLRLELHKCWETSMASVREKSGPACDSFRMVVTGASSKPDSQTMPNSHGKSQDGASASDKSARDIGRTSPSGHERHPWIGLMRNTPNSQHV